MTKGVDKQIEPKETRGADKLTLNNDALKAIKAKNEAMMKALNTRIEEVEEEFVMCRTVMIKGC
ncbi:hypothetical protein J1N35_036879 [Gossypium stocksii]|uniref:Uncharacterized protein n=1 Tax=Gossypium stocksii TaxID=47602 RepID=A0A9D3UJJ2_9ROSI|nr:hypothetical protein J1N35_036879 [Gossypium stocksii]